MGVFWTSFPKNRIISHISEPDFSCLTKLYENSNK